MNDPEKDLQELINQTHDPDARKQDGHVLILFSDGELCSTKGGELFGQRSLHQLMKPIVYSQRQYVDPAHGTELPITCRVGDVVWPENYTGNRCVFSREEMPLLALRAALIEEWRRWLDAQASQNDIEMKYARRP